MFNTNGNSAAENVTVTLRQAGAYKFTVKVTGPGKLTASSSVGVTVSPVLAKLSITPNQATVAPGGSQQFAAEGFDQFGRAIALPPGLTWAATAGTIASGRLVAPTVLENVSVTATDGSVQATATVAVGSNFLGISDPSLGYVTANLFARDGSINREDMIQILQSIGAEGSVVTAAELSGLTTILNDAARLGIPGYVQVLLGNVLDNNPADAQYQGQSLGQLVAGSPTAVLEDLSSKWFLGTDLPTTGGFNYQTTAGTLFGAAGPAYTDMHQGELGDCYFIASLGAIAKSNPTAIRDMFIDNGDNTWTVRFYNNGVADYVTVNRMLPVDGSGNLVFADYRDSATNPGNVLWIALAEKAYAQWNETGNEGRNGVNDYPSIAAGWMADVNAQVLGSYPTVNTSTMQGNEQTLINAIAANQAVTIGTDGFSGTQNGLVGGHAYAVIGYNQSAQEFFLYNPWGFEQPGPLTWSQLLASCDGFVAADASSPVAISLSQAASPPSPVVNSLTSAAWESRWAEPAHRDHTRAVDAVFSTAGAAIA